MVLFPILITMMTVGFVNIWPVLSIARRITGIIGVTTFVLMIALNFFWYVLILKGLKKLLKGSYNKV